ncbi:lysophospholipid acyltransferase family protein [candidate division KSB1 bacterium]|nr:lysophospholipid acyltransferase family protein [candidate division KSB1 bacterium]
MIPANHTWWADKVFEIYLRRLLKQYFHAIRMFDDLPEIDPRYPLILVPNHSTWWDGFFIYWLNKKFFRRRAYLMMLQAQLQKYLFFARIGAYSVEPANPKKILESLRYTLNIMQDGGEDPPLICIFPQGELLPWSRRPLNLKRGIDWLITHYRQPVNLLPLAMKAEFGGEQKPEAFFLFGQNRIVDLNRFHGMQWLEQTLSSLLNELDAQLAAGAKSQLLFAGSSSINTRLDRMLGKQ